MNTQVSPTIENLQAELAAVTTERDQLKRAREINLESLQLVVGERDAVTKERDEALETLRLQKEDEAAKLEITFDKGLEAGRSGTFKLYDDTEGEALAEIAFFYDPGDRSTGVQAVHGWEVKSWLYKPNADELSEANADRARLREACKRVAECMCSHRSQSDSYTSESRWVTVPEDIINAEILNPALSSPPPPCVPREVRKLPDACHVLIGPNGMCMCGVINGKTCGELLHDPTIEEFWRDFKPEVHAAGVEQYKLLNIQSSPPPCVPREEYEELQRRLEREEKAGLAYIENASGGCAACAEGVACGSVNAAHKHEGCIYAQYDGLIEDAEGLWDALGMTRHQLIKLIGDGQGYAPADNALAAYRAKHPGPQVKPKDCNRCCGTGSVEIQNGPYERKCPDCNGTGKQPNE